MKYRTIFFLLCFVVFLVLPCRMYAQGDETRPPTCCPEPESLVISPVGDATTTLSLTDTSILLTIPDSVLQETGLTRAQMLDLIAAKMLSLSTDQSYDLIIPIFSPTLAEDGSAAVSVTYYEFVADIVPAEVVDGLSLVFITDGRTTVAVLFTS